MFSAPSVSLVCVVLSTNLLRLVEEGISRSLSGQSGSRATCGRLVPVVNDPSRHFAIVNCRIAKGSLDHLVGDGEHTGRDGEPKCFCGLEVDGQLEFGRLHHRQIGRLYTPKNPAGVDAGAHSAEQCCSGLYRDQATPLDIAIAYWGAAQNVGEVASITDGFHAAKRDGNRHEPDC